MTAAATLMDPAIGPRRAALALHALSAQDRQWLLGQLAPVHRSRLEELLSELQELGIPRDRALVEEALATASAAAPAGLAGLPVAALWAALEGEPSGVQDAFLATLEPAERHAVIEHAARMGAPAAARPQARAVMPATAVALREALQLGWRDAAAAHAERAGEVWRG